MDRRNQLPLTPRDPTIDMVKGFSIMAVVLLHINYHFPKWAFIHTDSILGGLWHVAVFFVVSGWFLKDSKMLDFKTFAKGKIFNLYLKAMYVYIPFVFLHNIFMHIGWLFDDLNYRHGLLEFYSPLQIVKLIACQFLFLSREPFAGAMWFVDSLFLGLLTYSLVTITISRIFSDKTNKEKYMLRFVACFALACFSATLRDVFDLNFPKISNTLSALVLICIGQLLGSLKLKFNDKYLFVLALVIFVQYTILTPSVTLNSNGYKDVVFLIVSSISALYMLGFISKKITKSKCGGVISYVGKESFWIMGFHMLGFHLFTSVLSFVGFGFEHHFTTPDIKQNIFLLLGYFMFGVSIPLFIRYCSYNIVYKNLIKYNK